jgi:hypothetical protein
MEQAQAVPVGEMVRALAQGGQRAPVVFDLWSDLAHQFHEVVEDEPDDMEAVGDEDGVWEGTLDDAAVRAGEVDADDSDLLPALEAFQIGAQVGFRAARDDVKDAVVFQIGEGRGKTQALVKGVLIDAQEDWALKADALGSLATGELGIDARDGGGSNTLHSCQAGSRDAVVMMLIEACSERLGGSAAWKQSGQGLDEGTPAVMTVVTAAVDDQGTGLIKAIQMAGTAPIRALAAQAYACAARADNPCAPRGGQVQGKLVFVLA